MHLCQTELANDTVLVQRDMATLLVQLLTNERDPIVYLVAVGFRFASYWALSCSRQ